MSFQKQEANLLDAELPSVKKETIFLGTKVVINSRFNNFFDVLDSKDKKFGDTLNEKNFDSLLNKRALKYKLSIINKMRKNVLKHFLKDSLNSKVHSNKDFNFFKLINKNLNKSFLFLYIIFIFILLMSYVNIFDYLGLIFSIILIGSVLLGAIYFRNLRNIAKSNFRLSLEQFMNNFAEEMTFLEKTNKEVEAYGYKESFSDKGFMNFTDRVKIGLANVYNSDIIIPFIPDFATKQKQRDYLELFLINYGKIQTQKHFFSFKNLSPDFLKTLGTEKLVEIQNELFIKKEQLQTEKIHAINKAKELDNKAKELDNKIAQEYRDRGMIVLSREDLENKDKIKKAFLSAFE